MATLEERVKGLEEREALLFDLEARILGGNWNDGAESAQALLRAISPKYKAFEAVPFP